jgi:PadR family transcriptional regulator, regulatory protein AphA
MRPSPPLVRDPFLIKIFVGHLISPRKLLDMIEIQKTKRQKTLETYLEIEKKYFSDLSKLEVEEKFQRLVVQRGISHSKNWLKWVEDAEAFVKELST